MTSDDFTPDNQDDAAIGPDFDVVLAAEILTNVAANVRMRVNFSDLDYGNSSDVSRLPSREETGNPWSPAAEARADQCMTYIEAPHYCRPTDDGPSVFLAGGITGVERWHTRAAAALQAHGVTVFNPHRAELPIHDPNAGWEQASWQQHHLHAADVTLIWFPTSDQAVPPSPPGMFELGQALGAGRRIVVGADKDYPHEPEVRMICQVARPDMPVFSTLEDTVAATIAAVKGRSA